MNSWWERYPGILEAEGRALDATGWQWTIDEQARRRGEMVIRVKYPRIDGDVWTLEAQYPATYPYFPPAVILSEVTLPRHHHPLGKNLCLLARHGEDWDPGHDTLAGLILTQMPGLLATAQRDAVAQDIADVNEDHIGEPFSSFLEYAQNSVLVVPDDAPDVECKVGKLVIATRPTGAGNVPGNVHGLVKKITDRAGEPLVELNASLVSHTVLRDGYWMRLSEPPVQDNMDTLRLRLFYHMAATIPAFKLELLKAPVGKMLVAGFLFDDETTWRSKAPDWLFLQIVVKAKAKNSRNSLPDVSIFSIRADRGGEQTWLERAPMLKPLRAKKVLLVGAGSLGSPVAIHLARAGIGQLSIVDDDFVQVGNTIRWALGWQYAGYHKVDALVGFLALNYPYTTTDGNRFLLGIPHFWSTGTEQSTSDYEVLRNRIEAVDLVIDASASFRVSHFLSDLAIELKKPFMWLTTTHGCAGGIVGRRVPGARGGCWHCHNRSLADGSVPLPAVAAVDPIQPGGCSQATFVGAGIDSEEIALMASRLAVATLAQGQDGYADFNWNLAVCDLYRDGHPIAPSWHTSSMEPHPDCTECRVK